jgi:hypothetical protein
MRRERPAYLVLPTLLLAFIAAPASAASPEGLVAGPLLCGPVAHAWPARMRTAGATRSPGLPAEEQINEQEQAGVRGRDDEPRTAQHLDGHRGTSTVNGTLSPASQATTAIAPSIQDDGSIGLAARTGIGASRTGITTTGTIGDGPHRKTGDFDFYRVDAAAGATVIVRVTATDAELDPAVTLYDAAGNAVASNDERGNDINPVLVHQVTRGGAYYVMIAGSGSTPADPFDPAGGSGATATGGYRASIISSAADLDVYAVQLRAGDVLGVALNGAGDALKILDPGGAEVNGATGDGSAAYPAVSPLPHGKVTADHVAAKAGRHYLVVGGGRGRYQLAVTIARPELAGTGRVQTIALDFDGERVDPAIFAGSGLPLPDPPGPRDFAALSTFLPAWGLTAGDEVRLRAAIVRTVRKDLAGGPVNVVGGGTRFGRPDVSRVVIGGTVAATGLPTIGIAQSIDPGNFATAETAVVLLDGLSRPAGQPFSVNTHLKPGGDRIGYLGEVLGDYAAHEVGHLLGGRHTDAGNGHVDLMDGAADYAQVVAGPDGVGGTADDVPMRFHAASPYAAIEGNTGTQNSAARIACGLGKN